MHAVEFVLLNNGKGDENVTDIPKLVDHFICGNYEIIIQELLSETSAEVIKGEINRLVKGERREKFSVFLCGVSALQLFIQNNWTGPARLLTSNLPLESIAKELTFDGEEIYHLVKYPELLWLSKIILLDSEDFNDFPTIYWWRLRYLNIHQQILGERSPTICERVKNAIEKIGELESTLTDCKYRNLKVQLYLEISSLCFHFYEFGRGKDFLRKAQLEAQLVVQLTGALGKKSRFQQNDVPQLFLSITKNSENEAGNSAVESQDLIFPTDIELDDEVRLNTIKFKEADLMTYPDLRPEEQAIILGLFNRLQKTSAVDNLLDEELLTYLACILKDPKCWALQLSALICRSKLECGHRRTVERCLLQMETLLVEFSSGKAQPAQRLELFHCSNLPPVWNLEKILANLMMKMGATNGALDIFLRLELWDDVISCYHLLQRRSRAEAIVRQQLAIKETPLLWCYLGDATDDISHYHKAAELSNQKFSRAFRSLGNHYFHKKEYKECVPFYEKSLELNSLQLEIWFNLGYAAMHEEMWETATKAYRRYCNLEPENCEVWNNLANVYIKDGQTKRAWMMLQEALKHNFEDWRIWENYLLVSIDIGAFDEALRAYNRILDVKEKHADTEVIKILSSAVIQGTLDNNGKSATSLKSKLTLLCERILAKSRDNGEILQLYANLQGSEADLSTDDQYKVIQTLNKAFVIAMQQFKWKEAENTTRLSLNLLEKCVPLASGDERGRGSPYFPLLVSIKLEINSFITLLKRQMAENAITAEAPGILSSLLATLQERQSHYVTTLETGFMV